MSTIKNLTNQVIANSYQGLVQVSSSGYLYDGLGNLITDLQVTAVSASYVSPANIAAALGGTVFATTASNTFNGNQTINGNLTVYGSSSFIGIASFTYVTSSQLVLGTNTVNLQISRPLQRHAGMTVWVTGSTTDVTASILWDDVNEHWVYQYDSASYFESGVLIMGPKNSSTLGNETVLLNNRIPKVSGSIYLNDSNISDTGTYVSINSNTQITGSLNVSGSITGTFIGAVSGTATSASYALTASYIANAVSASYALTASYALNAANASGVGFPYTGSAIISGSLQVIGPITGSVLLISASATERVTIIGSGSSTPIFKIIGSVGELFSVSDGLSGSLFSVNNISGLPIAEIFSDNRIILGDPDVRSLYTTKKITATAGNNTIYSIATASYDGMYVDYVIKSGSNARAGQIVSIINGTTTNYTETTTTEIGSTSNVELGTIISGGNLSLTGSVSSGTWTIKTIIRSI